MFSSEQLKVISGILANLGHISITSVVLPFILPGYINGAVGLILLGSLLAILFWIFSILLVKNLS